MPAEATLSLTMLSPLVLRRTRSAVQYTQTLDYIPGTALRGAFAEAFLLAGGSAAAAEFEALFVAEGVQYGDLWPATQGAPTILLPASAIACKRHRLEHPDSLADGLLEELCPRQPPACPHPECGGSRLDRIGGYLSSLNPPQPLPCRTRIHFHTAMDRSTGTVAPQLLFSQKALSGGGGAGSNGMLFRATIRLAPVALAQLQRLAPVGEKLSLGAARSRGFGEVRVCAWEAVPAEPGHAAARRPQELPLEERWQRFNETARRIGAGGGARYFSLTLLSHLALRDDLFRPILRDISPQVFGLPATVVCRSRFLSAVLVPGWNAAQRMPKSDSAALARGSALLFECEASQESTILARLVQLEASGLGERRAEGFGQMVACYPIHYARALGQGPATG